MASYARGYVRVIKYLLAGMTVFCVGLLVSVSEWHYGVRWSGSASARRVSLSTMRTIVAYSEGKQAEMDRPSPVTCNRLPAFPEIPHIERAWNPGVTSPSLWQAVPGTGVLLYAAYYDERTAQKYVRILARFPGRNISAEAPLFCQTRPLNANEDAMEVVAARPLAIWWPSWDNKTPNVETPLLLSCPLTDSLNGPSVVSVVTQPCDDPTNGFLLTPLHRNINRMFTLCVKDMNFKKDISQQLVEWIEMNKILGADMIDVYVDEVSNETEKVLLHYRDQGYIRLFKVPIKHRERILWQRRRDHIITYNDCLYRNIFESEYIVPIDVDEIILPKIAADWRTLLKRLNEQDLQKKPYSAILIRNVFFFDFLQDIKPQHNISKTEIYTKRDDVRIPDELQKSSMKLIDDESISNEVIFNRGVNNKSYNKYKARCGEEMTVPKIVRNVIRSGSVSPPGFYVKSMMLTGKVLTAFNHYPLTSLNGYSHWSAPFSEVQLNHYKESCNNKLVKCDLYRWSARVDRSALRLRTKLEDALASAICVNKT